MMAETDIDDRSSGQRRPAGFKEGYESLSDHDQAQSNVNPFATGSGRRSSRPSVETVSSPQRSSASSASSSSSSSPMTEESSRKISGSLSPTFDPLASATALETGISVASTNTKGQQQQERHLHSLLDEGEEEEEDPSSRMGLILPDVRMTRNTTTGGMAGLLEMEAEPSRNQYPITSQHRPQHPHAQQQRMQAQQILEDQEDLIDFTQADEPIQTSSGLYLTHRRSSAENRVMKASHNHNRPSEFPASYRPSPNRFELEQTSFWGNTNSSIYASRGFGRTPASLSQARRLLSMAKLWVLFFCVVLVLGTAVLLHAFRHEDAGVAKEQQNQEKFP